MLARAVGSSVRLENVPHAGPVHVAVDPEQAEHVLLNLALNARDAMPQGGRLDVSVSTAELHDAAAAAAGVAPGRYAVLAVSDTGCGMPPNVLDHLFEPFFTTKAGGTGLGLPMVYGAVTQSRGSVQVESAAGKGTTFRILLPSLPES
jgi:signal transduction histidine kinase